MIGCRNGQLGNAPEFVGRHFGSERAHVAFGREQKLGMFDPAG